jgi:putative transposase
MDQPPEAPPEKPPLPASVPPSTTSSTHPPSGLQPRGWYSRKYLPHYDANGVFQHVTVHLADSLPASVVRSIQEEIQRLPEELREREHRRRLEAYLDSGYGSCCLGRPEIAELVQNAFQYFDGERYHLIDWVVMPNHFHVLFRAINDWPLGSIVGSWKTYTANRIGALITQPGQPTPRIWYPEYWDRFIRDEKHLQAVRQYIWQNPVKAGLVGRAVDWVWGSAHYREAEGDTGRVG